MSVCAVFVHVWGLELHWFVFGSCTVAHVCLVNLPGETCMWAEGHQVVPCLNYMVRPVIMQGLCIPQAADMFAEHANFSAADGARISADRCQYILDMLCHSSNIPLSLLPVNSLQVQVKCCSSCHVWQRPLPIYSPLSVSALYVVHDAIPGGPKHSISHSVVCSAECISQLSQSLHPAQTYMQCIMHFPAEH